MSSFTGAAPPFNGGGFTGYGNQQFNSFSNFDSPSSVNSSASLTGDSSPVYGSQAYSAGEDVFTSSQPIPETPSPPSIFSSGGGVGEGGYSAFSPDQNGNGGFGASEGTILQGPEDMEREKGYALREWRRLNAIQLEEKEKREKELRQQIIREAEEFKAEFYRKRQVTVENNKKSNREKEKQFAENREKFHAEADKNYWKAIGELIPREVPAIEKRGKKDKDKKPSVVVIQGPKPGKPTDLSRMRHILLKLKHNPPQHMRPKPLQPAEPKQDAKTSPADGSGTSEPPLSAPAVTKPEPLAVA